MSTETNHLDFDRELLSAYVDGELTGAERAAVEARLASDPAAQRQVDEFRRLSGMIQALPRPTLPGDFSSKVLQRAKESTPTEKVKPVRLGMPIGRTWRSWFWAGAALAAALMIAVMLPQGQRELADRGEVATSSPAPASEAVPQMRAAPSDDRPLPEQNDELLLADAARPRDDEPSQLMGRMSVPDDLDRSADALKSKGLSFSALPAEQGQVLIVRVSMPAESLQRREFDQLLAKQDIQVEAGEALDEAGGNAGEARSRQMQAGEPSAAGTTSKLERASVIDKLGVELAREEPVEFVFVEAPPEQIAATLSAMNEDVANYQVVEVERDSPTELRKYSRGLSQARGGFGGAGGESKIAEEKLAEGESVRRQPSDPARSEREENALPEERESPPSEAAAPPTAALEVPPPPAPAPAAESVPPAPAPATAAAPRGAVDRDAYSFEKQAPELGKAYRYLASDAKKLGTDRFSRRQLTEKELTAHFDGSRLKRDGKTPVQVLFVLEAAPPQLAAPAAEETPLPAAPVEPPK